MPRPAKPDKFRVGQTVILVMGKWCGREWERLNGDFGVVVGPPEYSAAWRCGPMDVGHEEERGTTSGRRYAVRIAHGVRNLDECHMRPIYDGEKLSTWAKFEKVTGLRLNAEPETMIQVKKKVRAH